MGKNNDYLWGGVLLIAIAGGVYLFRTRRLSNELEAVTGLMVHKFSPPNLVLRIDVTLKNPTAGSVKVKHPFLRLINGASVIGTSTVIDKDYIIPKYGEVKLDPVMVTTNLLTSGLLQDYLKQGKLNLAVKTTTTINNALPFEKIDKMTV